MKLLGFFFFFLIFLSVLFFFFLWRGEGGRKRGLLRARARVCVRAPSVCVCTCVRVCVCVCVCARARQTMRSNNGMETKVTSCLSLTSQMTVTPPAHTGGDQKNTKRKNTIVRMDRPPLRVEPRVEPERNTVLLDWNRRPLSRHTGPQTCPRPALAPLFAFICHVVFSARHPTPARIEGGKFNKESKC